MRLRVPPPTGKYFKATAKTCSGRGFTGSGAAFSAFACSVWSGRRLVDGLQGLPFEMIVYSGCCAILFGAFGGNSLFGIFRGFGRLGLRLRLFRRRRLDANFLLGFFIAGARRVRGLFLVQGGLLRPAVPSVPCWGEPSGRLGGRRLGDDFDVNFLRRRRRLSIPKRPKRKIEIACTRKRKSTIKAKRARCRLALGRRSFDKTYAGSGLIAWIWLERRSKRKITVFRQNARENQGI